MSRMIAPRIAVMKKRLEEVLRTSHNSRDTYLARSTLVRSIMLSRSETISEPNFCKTSSRDLRNMAEIYDSLFFDSTCFALARHFGLTFRWSGRMTRAGGKTTRTISRATFRRDAQTNYEITLSSSLLFQTFQNESRSVKVCGCLCSHRLEAMQRIVEHESIHLAEMLVWTDSDCSASRFQNITHQMFGHTEHRHDLVTQRERAARIFDVRVGSAVQFSHEGVPLVGVVNRITKRATVLVESPQGELYSNKKRYLKFYIPLSKLRSIKPTSI